MRDLLSSVYHNRMPKPASICVLLTLMTILVVFSTLHTVEFIRESFVDPYAGIDLSTLSDADRRTLSRASLTQQRAATLNSLSNVTTKVPPNCFDTSDAAYNTSACRMSRNAREAEINKLVSQAYIDFCKANPDCKQAQRSQYALNAWKAKCQTQSQNKLSDLAFLKQLLAKDNTVWMQMVDKDLMTVPSNQLGQISIKSQDATAAIAELTTQPLATSANIVRLDFKKNQATLYGDLVLSPSMLKSVSPSGTVAILVKKLGIGNAQIPGSVTDALTATDGWLDQYYYFQNSPVAMSDADRMQQCATLLSRDDFVTLGKQAYTTAQVASVVASPAVVVAAAAPSTNEVTSQLVSDYNSQRAQQAYPKSWYTNWQSVLKTRYTTTQQQYNTNLQLLNSLQTDKRFVSYNILKTLLDATVANNKVLQASLDSFDGGTYKNSPYCFPAGLEASYLDIGCCTLNANVKNAVVAYKQYCPEPTSVCARVAAAAGPDSAMFRTCKNYFANVIKSNQLTAQINAFTKDPTNKAMVDSFNSITAANASLLADLTSLQQVLALVAKDAAAAK